MYVDAVILVKSVTGLPFLARAMAGIPSSGRWWRPRMKVRDGVVQRFVLCTGSMGIGPKGLGFLVGVRTRTHARSQTYKGRKERVYLIMNMRRDVKHIHTPHARANACIHSQIHAVTHSLTYDLTHTSKSKNQQPI